MARSTGLFRSGIRLIVVALAGVWMLPFPFPAGLGFVAPAGSASSHEAASKTTLQQAVDRRGLLGLGALATLFPAQAPTARAFGDEDRSEYVTLHVDVKGGDGTETEPVVLKLHPDWAPRGVKRFHTIMNLGDLDGTRIHHVRKEKGMVLFGLPAEPTLPLPSIKNDLVRASNVRGTVGFKQLGGGHALDMNHREQELFINTKDNQHLDLFDVAPIGEIVEGMDVIDRVYGGYNARPHLQRIKREGSKYLDEEYPQLGRIVSASYGVPESKRQAVSM
eukprot:TRINITY_DN1869_c0_g1_i1.p1 TRINITY_DN1869_c0_g1~~TRINITY_DN1869_c0_g1_i1.p1  ORF type:complete len:277 (+),score=48.70 TRINITY_DN1869_c0_g1_i1:58-888(+)